MATALGNDFQKCGEISMTIQVDKKIYALNCIYCPTICMQLETFAEHIESEHQDQYECCVYLMEEEEPLPDNEDEFLKDAPHEMNKEEYVIKSGITIEPHIDKDVKFEKEENNEIALDFEDPLEEATMVKITQQDISTASEIKLESPDDEFDSGDDDDDDAESMSETNDDNKSTNSDEPLANDSESCSEQEDVAVIDDELSIKEDNKEIMLAIIEAYKKHGILWHADNPNSKNRVKREKSLQGITRNVNKEMKVNLNWKSVGKCIKRMRYKFRSDLQNKNIAEAKGEEYTPSWFYEKLAFLNTSIQYRERGKRGAKVLANEKPALPLTNLTDAQNLKLIEIYKSLPCLWDVQHIGFRFKNQRHEAMENMVRMVKDEINLSLNHDELQKKIYRIRYACTQEKHRKLQCERLDKDFTPICKYAAQIAFLEDNVGPFKCTFCEQTFNGADQYKIHKSQHDGSMPFTCPLCNRGFMKVGNCTVHLRRHTRDYPFECEVCKKRYATSTDLTVHMRYHTGEKPYFCEVCGQSFRTWTFFDAHMRRHQKRPNHVCSICSKAFYENNKLTEHMKAHLNVRDKICNVCGKAFTSSKYLRQHKLIHAEKKKYACKICGKDFAQYAGLSGHMKSHGTTVSGSTTHDEMR